MSNDQHFEHESLEYYLPATERETQRKSARAAASSITMTILIFMAALMLVRYVMPRMVEEVHYSIERGKQRAKFEAAETQLKDRPTAELSQYSALVSQRIAPSVVHIDTQRAPTTEDAPEKVFLSDPEKLQIGGQGSGVVVAASGEILTNYHVVNGAERIFVTLSDDREVEAEVIGVDQRADLAVLKVSAKGLTPATWGSSSDLSEGEFVWAIGSPFGLSKSITFGILSAKDRHSYEDGRTQEFLQSDAAVSPGNSGGPLVNSNGHVVGINTAILGPAYQGVSFSIPSDSAREVYERIRSSNPDRYGWLGVHFGKSVGSMPGALIVDFVDDQRSPAREAGIRTGDIITSWNGTDVESPGQLSSLVIKSRVDSRVDVELYRRGLKQRVKVNVGVRPLQFPPPT